MCDSHPHLIEADIPGRTDNEKINEDGHNMPGFGWILSQRFEEVQDDSELSDTSKDANTPDTRHCKHYQFIAVPIDDDLYHTHTIVESVGGKVIKKKYCICKKNSFRIYYYAFCNMFFMFWQIVL